MKTLDLDLLFPKKEKLMVTEVPRNDWSFKTVQPPALKSPDLPTFSNTIHLKAIGSNLLMQFGYVEETIDTGLKTSSSSEQSIMMSSETSKQLLIALAELFQCDIVPKSR